MTKYDKRSTNSGFLLFVYLLVNILIFFPFVLFFFYTLAQILPTLAVVADYDTPVYAPIQLSELYSDAPPSYPQASQASQSSFFSLGLGLRPMLSQLSSLRTRFKPLAFFRGLGVFTIICFFETLITALSFYFLPSLLAIFPQILLPLLQAQLYCLWTHTILTYPSTNSLWKRIPPFKATVRATGPALAVFLASKALMRFALVKVFGMHELRRHGDLNPQFLGALVLTAAGVQVIAVVPAHTVLTRVQASLLPADEKILLPIDKALRDDGNGMESRAIGMKEALVTFGWGAWGRLGLLYGQVFVVVLVGGGAVLTAAFVFYIIIAGMSIL